MAVKKFNFGKKLSGDAKKKEAGAVGYAGEKPPAGAYVFRLRRLFMDKDAGGEKISYLAEIDDPRERMQQYKGYPIWGGQHLNDQSAGYLNQMLIAFGNGNRLLDGFYENGDITTKIEETKNGRKVYHITKLGDEPVKADEIYFVGVTRDNSYTPKNGGKKVTNLQIASYVPISESPLGKGLKKNSDDEDSVEDYEEAEENYEDPEEAGEVEEEEVGGVDESDIDDDEDLFNDDDDE